jgi:hypothetical protein
MNTPSASSLLKASCFCILLAGHAFGQALSSDDSLSQGQQYNYTGGRYQGVTSDVVLNGVLEVPSALSSTVSQAGAFLTQISSFGAWTDLAQPQGYAGVSGAVGLGLPNLFLNESVILPGQKQDPYFAYRMGPFYVDQVYGGIGAIYSDVQGSPPGINGLGLNDDNWAGITWLSARFTAYITDRFALTLNPWIYWLPLKGEVGWAAGGGFFGLNSWMAPQSAATIGFHVPVGRWDFSFYDQFQAFFLQDSILSENFFVNAQAWDMSPVDPAGRFQFGGLGPSYVDMTGDTRLSSNGQLFRSDRLFFRNNGHFNVTTTIGESTSFSTYYNRYDFWNDDFEHQGQWDTVGALVARTTGNVRPFVNYEATSWDGWESSFQWLLTGAAFRVNPQVLGYAKAGYLWSNNAGQSNEQDSVLGVFGMRHQLGPYTMHSFEAGRSVTDPEFNSRTRSDYLSYIISHQLGHRLSASLFATYSDRLFLGGVNNGRDQKSSAVGALVSCVLDERSTLSLFSSFERLQMDDIGRGWDLWTYRANYFRRVGETVSLHMMYQYQHAGSGANPIDNFSEHLIYTGVMKKF